MVKAKNVGLSILLASDYIYLKFKVRVQQSSLECYTTPVAKCRYIISNYCPSLYSTGKLNFDNEHEYAPDEILEVMSLSLIWRVRIVFLVYRNNL